LQLSAKDTKQPLFRLADHFNFHENLYV
jgi:hypothetical protein